MVEFSKPVVGSLSSAAYFLEAFDILAAFTLHRNANMVSAFYTKRLWLVRRVVSQMKKQDTQGCVRIQ